jgi:four helix bundle protein
MKATGNVIVDMTYEFSLNILEYTDRLEQACKFAVANQLTKSGTSIGANVRESQGSESQADFVHKLKISEKEMFETEYWLSLCKDSRVLPDPGKLPEDIESTKKVLRKILGTCYQKGYGPRR